VEARHPRKAAGFPDVKDMQHKKHEVDCHEDPEQSLGFGDTDTM
jgi:hypothetical protein